MSTWGGRKAQRQAALCFALYGTACYLCGRPGADTVDHVVPRQHGGSNSLDNLRPAHRYCNQARGNRTRHAATRPRPPIALPPPVHTRTW